MSSNSVNPFKPTNGSSNSSSPSSGSERSRGSSNNNISQDFSALQEQSKKMRGDRAASGIDFRDSRNANQVSEVKAEDLEDAHNDTKLQETAHISNANEAKANASRLNNEAATLKAAAKGRDARVGRQLKLQAKEKELKALMEEYRARKEENDAYEAGRKANALKNQAADMRRAEEANMREANTARVDSKDLEVQSGNVDSQLKEAEANQGSSQSGSGDTSNNNAQANNPTSANPQETGQSPIGQGFGPTSANPQSSGTSPIGQGLPPVGMQGGQPTNNPNTGYGLGNAQIIRGTNNPLVAAARALLRAVSQITKAPRNINPTNMLSMHRTNKTLYDLAVSYLDTAQTQSAIQGTPVNQEIIFTRTQATAGKGETEVAIQYWQNMQQQNVQAEKDTFKHAERA